MATLSVGMPCHNHAKYVAQAVRAIDVQSRRADEFWVIDDGSTDTSAEVVESLQQQGARLALVRQTPNRGVVPTLAAILQRATGQYLYFAAADDYVLPRFFEQALALAEAHPQAGVVFGAMLGVDEAGRTTREYRLPRRDAPCYLSPAQYAREVIAGLPAYRSLSGATIYRRDALGEVGGFRPELGHWCDTFAIHAIALKYGACYVPRPCMAWRRLPGSFSAGKHTKLADRLAVIDRAAVLMRSAEFAARFPRELVDSWQRRYHRAIYLRTARDLALRATSGLVRRAA